MSLFKKYLASARVAEDMDDKQTDPDIENEDNDKPIVTESSLGKRSLRRAEDDSAPESDEDSAVEASADDDDDKDDYTMASDDDDKDDDEDGEPVDKVVDAVADEVEKELEAVINDVKALLKKAKASPKVAAAVIEGLRGNGFLMKNPLRVDLKKAKFNKGEEKFIRNVVFAAKEAAEDILKAASYTLIKNKKTQVHARQLDQVLRQDGFIKSRVANPVVLGTVKQAESAVKNTRKARRTIKK